MIALAQRSRSRWPTAVGDVAGVQPADRVVVVVVGQHRDPARPYARLEGERLVAADRHVLGVAQAVPLDQVPPEQLGVGQRPRQGGVEEVHLRLGAGEDGLVDVAAVDPDDAAQHDVGVVPVGRRDEPLQRLRAEVVVGADEEDVPAGGVLEAPVARRRRAARVGLVDHLDRVRVQPGEPVQLPAAAVGGAVVDRDDLQPVRADRLLDQRGQAPGQVGHGVVDGGDDGHIGHGHVLTPTAGCAPVVPATGSAAVASSTGRGRPGSSRL